MRSYEHYCQLAELFDYPGADYVVRGQRLVGLLRESYPDAAEEVERFLGGIPQETLDLQELYTRTFDVQAITTLDIGYVMFGDDYKRAELLSNLTREHKQVENDCRGELADHLPNMLRLIPRLVASEGADLELVDELVREILVPALMLMIREFDSERIEKKNASYQKHYKTLIVSPPGNELTIYCRALKALLQVLRKDFQVTETIARLSDWSAGRRPADCRSADCRSGCQQSADSQTVSLRSAGSPSADFLGFIEKEMEIETNANPVNSGCDS